MKSKPQNSTGERVTMQMAVTMDIDTAERIDAIAAQLGLSPEEVASFFVARYAIPDNVKRLTA